MSGFPLPAQCALLNLPHETGSSLLTKMSGYLDTAPRYQPAISAGCVREHQSRLRATIRDDSGRAG